MYSYTFQLYRNLYNSVINRDYDDL